MNIHWRISTKEAGNFMNTCEAIIRNVGTSTKAATEQACAEIYAASIEQVPKDTGTLASSCTYIVRQRTDIDTRYRYEGIIGYAGFATTGFDHSQLRRTQTKHYSNVRTRVGAIISGWERTPDGLRNRDPVNPKNGLPASAYAAVVHEDLEMPHPRGGKAKFLEDPVREYGQANFTRVAETYWKWAIRWHDAAGTNKYGRDAVIRVPTYGLVRLSDTQAQPHASRNQPLL